MDAKMHDKVGTEGCDLGQFDKVPRWALIINT